MKNELTTSIEEGKGEVKIVPKTLDFNCIHKICFIKEIYLNSKVTNLRENVAEGEAKVEKELEALRELVRKQKVGNGELGGV